jgi:hypothetical protein
VDPPTPHGFLFVTDSTFLVPVRLIPAFPVHDAPSINVALGFVGGTTDGDDDGDDPQ